MLALADNPNSHASCVAFVVWGMFLLVRWWQTGSIWRGALAGFLLGYACLIRYSEGLLILPILVATLLAAENARRETYLKSVAAVVLMVPETVTSRSSLRDLSISPRVSVPSEIRGVEMKMPFSVKCTGPVIRNRT